MKAINQHLGQRRAALTSWNREEVVVGFQHQRKQITSNGPSQSLHVSVTTEVYWGVCEVNVLFGWCRTGRTYEHTHTHRYNQSLIANFCMTRNHRGGKEVQNWISVWMKLWLFYIICVSALQGRGKYNPKNSLREEAGSPPSLELACNGMMTKQSYLGGCTVTLAEVWIMGKIFFLKYVLL